MNQKEIIQVFEEKGKKGTMFRNDPDSIIYGLYECEILDITVTLQDNTEITIFCGEKSTIDITHSDEDYYVGFGDTLIEPMSNIKKIAVNWR